MNFPARFVGLMWVPLMIWCQIGCQSSTQNEVQNENTSGSLNAMDVSKNEGFQFKEVEQGREIQHTYRNGEESDQYTYLEAMGGGLGVIDYDRDSWPDLFIPGGGLIPKVGEIVPLPGTLWRNDLGQGFDNVSIPSGSGILGAYTQGVCAGDFNNDGFADLLVTGFQGLQFFVNQGDGTFRENAVACGLQDRLWSSSAAFGDLNGDGNLDLYIAHYVNWSWEDNPECKSTAGTRDICPPGAFAGLQDIVMLNLGDGTFRPQTQEIGLVPEGKGLGVVCVDLNGDQKQDIYVANDATNNYLYINRGDGRFDERGVPSGTALDDRGTSNGSMGISILDYDGDLLPDIWVCNYENETFALYKNDGNSSFRYVTSSVGVTALGRLYVAFGTIAGDFDRDGDEDIVVANGHVLRFPPGNTVEQFPLMIENNGKGKLIKKNFDDKSYFGRKWRGRGTVMWDFDQDGNLDIGFSNVNQPTSILHNETRSNGNWIMLELIGTQSNRDAIGSKVLFKTDKRQMIRFITGGGSYMSQSSYLVHCGIPSDEVLEHINITWPNGQTRSIEAPALGKIHQIVEQNDVR